MKSKVMSSARAADVTKGVQKRGQKVVFTNGCFDIIHAGHVRYLTQAKGLGDFLVIGLNTDESVRRLKGTGRPIVPFTERAYLLAHLSPVDLVVGFSDDTPLKLIKRLRPDILAKGADYTIGQIIGADEVKSWGGTVKRIRLVKGKSTTSLIERIRNGKP